MVFINAPRGRDRRKPPVWRKDAPISHQSDPHAVAPAAIPVATQPRRAAYNWLFVIKLAAAAMAITAGIYFLATAQPGRPIYDKAVVGAQHVLPSYPGHRNSESGMVRGGAEHSLADRPLPTDQSFIATFGGSRSLGGAHAPAPPGGGEADLPEKVRLREDLAGVCDVGSKGRTDTLACLRRHLAGG
jgi:hypothetical protein